MAVVAWTDIEGFANVRKHARAYPNILGERNTVTYRAKVKLHGQNMAVQCPSSDSNLVIAQSRTAELSLTNDLSGFAHWVFGHKDPWKNPWVLRNDLVIYGEWCGPGIQKGVAVNKIPNKIFAVFAARSLKDPNFLIIEPDDLNKIVAGIPDVYVLPWAEPTVEIDWLAEDSALTPIVDTINKCVEVVEVCDPWIETTFNVKGTGEGLVFYPVSHLGAENFANLCFKAKGEKHRVVKSETAAQINPETAANIEQFVDMVLTEARLEQGAIAVCSSTPLSVEEALAATESLRTKHPAAPPLPPPALSESAHTRAKKAFEEFLAFSTPKLNYDKRLTGKFISWIEEDVKKETQDILEASGLVYEQVQKALVTKARAWFLAKGSETK